MTITITSMTRFVAIASLATMIGATSALAASDKTLNDISVKQAAARTHISTIIVKSRELGISPKRVVQLDRIQAKQAESRLAIMATVEQARELGISPKHVVQLNRIQAKRAESRLAILALLEKSRELGISPKAAAMIAPEAAKIPGNVKNEFEG